MIEDVTAIVDATEIASRLAVEPGTVHSWRKRHDDFPEPRIVLAVGPIWFWPDIELWAQATGRLTR